MSKIVRTIRSVGLVAGAAALALNWACYSYTPVATGLPPAGERVRVQLTTEASTELARFLGPRVSGADGVLTSVSSDGAMVIAVETVQTVDGVRQPWTGEGLVTFPQSGLTLVQRRSLDRRRTTIGTIALVASVLAVAVIALRSGGAKGAEIPGGGTPPE